MTLEAQNIKQFLCRLLSSHTVSLPSSGTHLSYYPVFWKHNRNFNPKIILLQENALKVKFGLLWEIMFIA